VEWPPQSLSELISGAVDARQSYEIGACCGVCRGSGQVPDAKNPRRAMTCPTCRGQGTVLRGQCNGHRQLLRFRRVQQTVTTKPLNVLSPETAVGRRARLEAQRKEKQKEGAEQAAPSSVRPEADLRGFDGECSGIERALKRVAHGPGSIDVENCTDPQLTREKCWVTRCGVRGRNAFGGMILQRKVFSMSKLGVEEIDG
jgi:hypothetical protein